MNIVRIFLIVLAAIPAFFVLEPLHAQTLRVGGVEWFPYYYAENGVQKGVFVSLYAELEKRSGISIKVVPASQKRMLLYFRERTIDAESFTNPAWRESDSAISVYTVPVMESVDVVIMLKNRGISASSERDFEGKTIGCNLGFYYGEGFNEAFEQKRIIRDDAAGSELCLRKLQAGRVDAVILDRLEAGYVMRKIGADPDAFAVAYTFRHVSPLSLRLHTSKKNLIPRLNDAIRSMSADGFVDRLLYPRLKK